jgi:sterol desaturase/sphingolipid hydroxylase (fatty acid hydroxylase superfamily)
MILTFFIHILCYDIWFYISHIVLHYKYIYFIHKIHHAKQYSKLNYNDTFISHYIENIIQPLGIFIPFLFNQYIDYTSILSFLFAFFIIIIRGLMRHDHKCSWLIGNHHLLHHKYINYNFGEYWIDTICYTKYPNDNEYIYGKIYT